jgi:hypothetical protein
MGLQIKSEHILRRWQESLMAIDLDFILINHEALSQAFLTRRFSVVA